MTISLTYDEKVAQRASALCEEHRHRIFAQTDHLFVGLMVFQWLAAIGAALWLSPTTWAGQYSHIHLHVWTAVFVEGAITLYPIMLAWQAPGKASTRYMIAASQMLMSALLIDVTGGRIETHFHIFGSLAFLALVFVLTITQYRVPGPKAALATLMVSVPVRFAPAKVRP